MLVSILTSSSNDYFLQYSLVVVKIHDVPVLQKQDPLQAPRLTMTIPVSTDVCNDTLARRVAESVHESIAAELAANMSTNVASMIVVKAECIPQVGQTLHADPSIPVGVCSRLCLLQ